MSLQNRPALEAWGERLVEVEGDRVCTGGATMFTARLGRPRLQRSNGEPRGQRLHISESGSPGPGGRPRLHRRSDHVYGEVWATAFAAKQRGARGQRLHTSESGSPGSGGRPRLQRRPCLRARATAFAAEQRGAQRTSFAHFGERQPGAGRATAFAAAGATMFTARTRATAFASQDSLGTGPRGQRLHISLESGRRTEL